MSQKVVFRESCAHLEVIILHLLKCLSSCKRDKKILLCIAFVEESGAKYSCPKAALFVGCCFLVSSSPPFPDQHLIEYTL